MRNLLTIVGLCLAAGCSGSTSPSGDGGSIGSTTNLAGAWSGTFASSNNPTEQISMDLTQSGSNVTGTWRGTTVAWTGGITGRSSSRTFTGQLTFTGTAFDGTTCTGTAQISGSASESELAWTSTAGVVGASCAAPLPVGIRLELRR